MCSKEWQTIFTSVFSDETSEYCTEIWPSIVALDQCIKPAILWDCNLSQPEAVVQLLKYAHDKQLVSTKLKTIIIQDDIFVVNIKSLINNLLALIQTSKDWIIDITNETPKMASKEVHTDFQNSLITLLNQLDLSTNLQDQNSDCRSLYVLDLPDTVNLSTLFGAMLGYPQVYWWQGDKGEESLAGIPLKVYKMCAQIVQDNTEVELYSYSIPEVLEPVLRFRNYRNAFEPMYHAFSKYPYDPRIEHYVSVLSESLVERWNFPMVNDITRNTKYRNALTRVHQKGSILDIGSGSGLLGIYAKEAGFEVVHACESSRFKASICQNVLEENEAEDITLHVKNSTRLSIPEDCPEKFSMVVTEVFDAGLFGEDCLNTLRHALHELINIDSNPKVIPSKAELFVVLIQSDDVACQIKTMVDDCKNITLKLEDPYLSEKLNKLPRGYQLLSDWCKILEVNFNSIDSINEICEKPFSVDLTMTGDGRVDGIALAFKLYIDDDNIIDTFPTSPTCWENAIYPVYNYQSASGEVAKLSVSYDRALHISLTCDSVLPDNSYITGNSFLIKCQNSLAYREFYRSAGMKTMKFLNDLRQCDSLLPQTISVLDVTPYPIAGMECLKQKGTKLYVRDQDVLDLIGDPNVSLMNEADGQFDAVFLWPIEPEGCMDSSFPSHLDLLKSYLHENTIVFPGKIVYNLQGIHSEELRQMTSVVGTNNSLGVDVRALNIAETKHQLDTPLSTLNHLKTTDVLNPLKLYTDSRHVPETVVTNGERLRGESLIFKDNLYRVKINAKKLLHYSTDAFAYWFTLHGSPHLFPLEFSLSDLSFDSLHLLSPTYQAMLMADELQESNDYIKCSFNYADGCVSVSSI